MEYDDPVAFRHELYRRLGERFGVDRMQLVDVQREVLFDRLLARMVATLPKQWVLSGDFAMALRFPERPRKSWAIDIEWPGFDYLGAQEIPDLIEEHEHGDLFRLEIARDAGRIFGSKIRERRDVDAWLGEDHFATASLNVKFDYAALPSDRIHTADLLSFAGIDPVEVRVVPLALQAAELFRDHVRDCEKGLDPTRVDRLRDLCLIAARSGLDAGALRQTVFALCEDRDRDLPDRMPDPFGGWAAPMRKMAAMAGRPDDFIPGYDGVVALFDPILRGEVERGVWDATSRTWWDPFDDGGNEKPPLPDPSLPS